MHLMILATVVVAALGFVALHFALTHKTAELRVAGWVLVIGALVNSFFFFYYPESPPQGYGAPLGNYAAPGHTPGKQCHGKWKEHTKQPSDK
ncbi:MAG: hypothetical protein SFX19_04755 [Alphaproteobacteria bacterium]|nr:hypothetical protein [Alphaproteobacteria bacterium]